MSTDREPITEERYRSVVSEMRQWKGNHAEEVRKKQEAHRRLTEARAALTDALSALDDIATLLRDPADAEAVGWARKRALSAAAGAHEALRGEP